MDVRQTGSDPLAAAREAYLEAAEVIGRACRLRSELPQAVLAELLQEALSAGRAASVAVRCGLIEEGDASRRRAPATGRNSKQTPSL